MADSFLHSLTKSSSFREIFDRKKLTNTHAHTQTEMAKTIYPLYTLYAGGITRILSKGKWEVTEIQIVILPVNRVNSFPEGGQSAILTNLYVFTLLYQVA